MVHYGMLEQVVSVNEIMRFRTGFEVEIEKRWPGAKVAVMDVFGLVSAAHAYPPGGGFG